MQRDSNLGMKVKTIDGSALGAFDEGSRRPYQSGNLLDQSL
jgi:hypothetical protein